MDSVLKNNLKNISYRKVIKCLGLDYMHDSPTHFFTRVVTQVKQLGAGSVLGWVTAGPRPEH